MKNLYAYTAAISGLPPYVSLNEDNGVFKLLVRTAGINTPSIIELDKPQVLALGLALLKAASTDDVKRYKYYIVDSDLVVKGTDDDNIASQFAASDEYAVLDLETGAQLIESNGDYIRVDEA